MGCGIRDGGNLNEAYWSSPKGRREYVFMQVQGSDDQAGEGFG
jgi:hypothetical protein